MCHTSPGHPGGLPVIILVEIAAFSVYQPDIQDSPCGWIDSGVARSRRQIPFIVKTIQEGWLSKQEPQGSTFQIVVLPEASCNGPAAAEQQGVGAAAQYKASAVPVLPKGVFLAVPGQEPRKDFLPPDAQDLLTVPGKNRMAAAPAIMARASPMLFSSPVASSCSARLPHTVASMGPAYTGTRISSPHFPQGN